MLVRWYLLHISRFATFLSILGLLFPDSHVCWTSGPSIVSLSILVATERRCQRDHPDESILAVSPHIGDPQATSDNFWVLESSSAGISKAGWISGVTLGRFLVTAWQGLRVEADICRFSAGRELATGRSTVHLIAPFRWNSWNSDRWWWNSWYHTWNMLCIAGFLWGVLEMGHPQNRLKP